LFKDGRESLEDDPRSGSPITAHTGANIERVLQIIDDNSHSTFDDIVAQTSLGRGTVQEIVYDSLGLKKLTSRWIPHDLTDKNRKDRVDACRENLANLKKANGGCMMLLRAMSHGFI
jgi:histone-lysine N-methyltransferase SETMAR